MDNLNTSETQALIQGCTVAFNTLGAGQPSKLTKEQLYTTDVVYARDYAKTCASVNVQHLSLLGVVSADKDSSLYTLRIKGEAEQACVDQGFKRTSLYRPSALITKGNRYGWIDVVNQKIVPLLTWMAPSKYHEIKVEELGKAMVVHAEAQLENEDKVVEYLYYSDCMRILNATE